MTGELISREEALRVINAYDYRGLTIEDVKKVTDGCANEILKLPAVDAVPVVHGRWIDGRGSWSTSNCSVCGWKIPYGEDAYLGYTKYCPDCGARMDEEADDALD